jgi:hypothetical protein
MIQLSSSREHVLYVIQIEEVLSIVYVMSRLDLTLSHIDF